MVARWGDQEFGAELMVVGGKMKRFGQRDSGDDEPEFERVYARAIERVGHV